MRTFRGVIVALGCVAASTAPLAHCVRAAGIEDSDDLVSETNVPKTWDDKAMESLELPLAEPRATPKHVSADYYYQIPAWKIYRSYPVYHPDKEPAGYVEALAQKTPEIIWDEERHPKLETEEDWIAAGEMVFDLPIGGDFGRMLPSASTSVFVRDRRWYEANGVLATADGVVPYFRYLIREKGKVELGTLSCAMCHTRVMPDGTAIKGGQGNFPFSRVYAAQMVEKEAIADGVRGLERLLYGAPWVAPDSQTNLWETPVDRLAAVHAAVPAGVIARHRSSPNSPVVVPDLFGLQKRRYLDRTGLQRHRDIGDLMRYAALNQGMDNLSSFDGFIPSGDDFKSLPDPKTYRFLRYSDEQLFALAKYAYAVKAPENPHQDGELAERGAKVFATQGCAKCHEPEKDYGSDLLVAAPGFVVPREHPEKSHVMARRVGTDATLTLTTRRGTGFYKVPSLRNVWCRGPFEHNGSVATLEDWFDPRRLDDDYVPTGWKGPPGTTTRAVKGHAFGLRLSADDRRSLIAFLKTL